MSTGASTAAYLYAHQGGWDEILLVATPLLILAGLLALANKRAKAIAETKETVDEESPS